MIDKELLKEQLKFLSEYPWREQGIPEEVVGIMNLIESLLEEDNG